MGEIFEQTLPGQALEWTGERLTTGAGGQVEIEHLHRYMLARDFCRGLDVLDIASGEGYGTALLAQVARSATGVEISAEAAGHAAAQYRAPNLRYLQGDARKIPLADQSVDLVASFETIEHFFEHDDFLAEIRRVLRPGGRLLVSSPDRDIYSPPGSPANAYHVRELTRAEFATLLGRFFAHVRMLGQRPLVGSALLADNDAPGPTVTIERRGPARFERSDGLPRAVYLLAMASDAELPPLPNSVFIESDAVGPLLARAAGHDPAMAALDETRRRAETAETAFHASREEIAKAMREAAEERDRAATQIAAMNGEIDRMRRELAETPPHDPASLAAEHEAKHEAAWARQHAATEAERRAADERIEEAAAAEQEARGLQAEAEAALEAVQAERDAARAEVRDACSQRDVARMALRRASVSAENAWAARLAEANRQHEETRRRARDLDGIADLLLRQKQEAEHRADAWRLRYDTLRGRLERLLRRYWIYQASRLVPSRLRRFLRERLASGTRP